MRPVQSTWGVVFAVMVIASCRSTPPSSVTKAEESQMGHHHGGQAHFRAVAGEPSGVSGDIADVCQGNFSQDVSAAQQAVINSTIATHGHRISHALWHAMRAGLSDAQVADVSNAFGNLWVTQSPDPEDFHKLCPASAEGNLQLGSDPGGEDFLYMHHGMLLMIQTNLATAGLPCIQPWQSFADFKNQPIPDNDHQGPKSPTANSQIGEWDQFFQNPSQLSKLSLGQLGIALEFTIHNNLHMRFATARPAPAFRAANPADDGAPIPYNGDFPKDWNFDDPAYNWLADPYGAAVNPVFWKIHGYVDHFIQMWLQAHGFHSIQENCDGDKSCYTWAGRWVGDPKTLQTAAPGEGLAKALPPQGNSFMTTAEFNRLRMKHQRIGVIQSEKTPSRPGAAAAAAPEDPYQTAVRQLCGP